MIECAVCDAEFSLDDCEILQEDEGGPICFACLCKADADPLFAACVDILFEDSGDLDA